MIITCPTCGTSFKVHDDVVPEYGRKMRCSSCGEVWLVKKEQEPEIIREELVIEEPTNERVEPTFDAKSDKSSTEEFGDIYQRLNAKSESIESEYEKMSGFRKFTMAFKKKTGLDSRFNRILFYIALLGVVALGLLQFRFDIVRHYPKAAYYYNLVGIKVTAIGYGLEFKNVSRSEIELNDKKFIIVKGFIHNRTEKEIVLPKLQVQMFGTSGNLIKEFSFEMKEKTLAENNQFPFDVLIEKQKAFVKYIILTFTE
ncbi:MAG: zinc-ribbon domain-containing protein [Alphaproteobacteria bacterium]